MMTKPIPENQMKRKIRQELKAVLADMDDQARHAASAKACARLAEMEEFKQASVVMLFMPLITEVDVAPLALRAFQQGRTVCVPKMDWQRDLIIPVEVTGFDDRVMSVDEHGIRVPRDGRAVSHSMIDLVVVPGIAFDVQGNRLGRGGGHYDRFLARLRPDTKKIAIAFDAQVVDAVPTLAHDVPVDAIVTERRLTRVNSTRAAQ